MAAHPEYADDVVTKKKKIPLGELFFFGTCTLLELWKNSIESVHPF
jgi:hypothetical protein